MKQITAAIITIGDELLIGQTLDTNSGWMAGELNRIGIWVHRRVAVGDRRESITRALDEESAQANVVLLTGGLGPTADDITKPVLCDYFGGKLVEDAAVLASLEERMIRSGSMLEARIRAQAQVPDVCTVLANDWGTAPGMWFEKDGKVYVSMPGVPHEMQGLMRDRVIPRLKERFVLPVILHHTLVTMGLGESQVADRLQAFESSLPENLSLAYLPGNAILKLRLTVRGEEAQRAAALLEQHYLLMQEALADVAVADADVSLEVRIGELLKAAGKTAATAESCTGGYIAHRLTSMAGSSTFFKGAVVSYVNEVKAEVLSVPEDILDTAGAVSEATVRAMLKGVLRLIRADYGVAITGFLGPDGGTADAPVGTVWIAAGTREAATTRRLQLRYTRSRNMEIAANHALNLLRQAIAGGA